MLRFAGLSRPAWTQLTAASRTLATTPVRSSMDEFFEEYQSKVVTVGRAWTASDLRHKSFDDLQKLWFVLLKERNMLATMQHEARKRKQFFPSPERHRMVRASMRSIRVVLGERERALDEAKRAVDTEEAIELIRATNPCSPLLTHLGSTALTRAERLKMEADQQQSDSATTPSA